MNHNTLQAFSVFKILVASNLCPSLSSLPSPNHRICCRTDSHTKKVQNKKEEGRWKRIWMVSCYSGIMLRTYWRIQGLCDGPVMNECFLLRIGLIRPWCPLPSRVISWGADLPLFPDSSRLGMYWPGCNKQWESSYSAPPGYIRQKRLIVIVVLAKTIKCAVSRSILISVYFSESDGYWKGVALASDFSTVSREFFCCFMLVFFFVVFFRCVNTESFLSWPFILPIMQQWTNLYCSAQYFSTQKALVWCS